jgi:UDP-glucose 4-epimerase
MKIELSGRRVLVVGAAGFIGRHVVSALESQGATPVGFDFAPAGSDQSHLDWVTGSVSDGPLLASAAAGCYGVVFLANSSLPGIANVPLADEVEAHVQTSVNAAEICGQQDVERFVFASSGGTVYGYSSERPLREDDRTEPRNAYGVSKLSIEHYLRLINMAKPMTTVSLRISNPFGEGQRANRNQGFIAAAMDHLQKGKTFTIWGDGSVERDFIHVADVADAFLSALSRPEPPQTVNIGRGSATSLLQVLEDISAITGRSVPVHFDKARSVDVERNLLDISLAKETLDWAPRISWDDGLRRVIRWWDAQKAT